MADLRRGRAYGPPDLCAAAQQCEASFVLLVDQSSLAWAQRGLRRAHRSLPGHVDLRILAWQDLHRVLTVRIRRGQEERWMKELSRYLARVDLDGFTGALIDGAAAGRIRLLLGWPGRRSDALTLSETAHRLISTYRQSAAIRRWSKATPKEAQFNAMDNI